MAEQPSAPPTTTATATTSPPPNTTTIPSTKKAPSSLPSPFNLTSSSPTPMTLISQGAEAHLYKTTFLHTSLPTALKIRPSKPWRHSTLDKRLTRARLLAEARVLVKCRREGVPVPAVYAVDWEGGWMASEWIEGVGSVKEGILRWEKDLRDDSRDGDGDGDEQLKGLLGRIGSIVGRLHAAGIVHGDLTTSNMMLQSSPSPSSSSPLSGKVILIDFGLATQTVSEEDRAVDLYVLERAFGSTHPRREHLFGQVLAAYEGSYKGAKATLRKLEEVRMRGRKKSMLG